MLGYALDFTPPMEGLDKEFWNTFRLGKIWHTRLKEGDSVFLLNKNKAQLFGMALVVQMNIGRLDDMAKQFAFKNHNQLGVKPARRSAAAERLMENMTKRYGPHIVHPGKLTTVITLQRITASSIVLSQFQPLT